MTILTKAMGFAALFAGCIFAQRPFGVPQSSPPDPATVVQNKVDRLTSLLSLTTAQVTQATTIYTNAQTAITPLQTSLGDDWAALQAAVKSNATATIDQLSTSVGTLTGQITAIQNKANVAFYAILTTDQQTKLNSTPGGFGGPGGPGGPGLRMRRGQ